MSLNCCRHTLYESFLTAKAKQQIIMNRWNKLTKRPRLSNTSKICVTHWEIQSSAAYRKIAKRLEFFCLAELTAASSRLSSPNFIRIKFEPIRLVLVTIIRMRQLIQDWSRRIARQIIRFCLFRG